MMNEDLIAVTVGVPGLIMVGVGFAVWASRVSGLRTLPPASWDAKLRSYGLLLAGYLGLVFGLMLGAGLSMIVRASNGIDREPLAALGGAFVIAWFLGTVSMYGLVMNSSERLQERWREGNKW